jgi:hypothetical protein
MHFTHGVKLSMVGRCDDAVHDGMNVPLFCKADLELHCGLTQQDEFSLGREGVSNITLTNYKFHDTRASLMAALDDEGKSLYRYREEWTWRRHCADQGYKFTGAFINSIYKKTASVKVWFYCQWGLRTNAARVTTFINVLEKQDQKRVDKIHANR